jgi:UDPglucose 6-dehydrogenase
LKIAVIGLGYVGLSMAVLLASKYKVYAHDISEKKILELNEGIIPFHDPDIPNYLKNNKKNITFTTNTSDFLSVCDFVIIAAPTNFDEDTNYFDTKTVEDCITEIVKVNSHCSIVIKSTIPFNFTKKLNQKYNFDRIIFSPEFLREGSALKDNLYPSRIIVGSQSEKGILFANMLKDLSLKKDVKVILTNSSEAESIKLFSNTYLAMRVSFFNELDTFCYLNNLNANNVINGVSCDARIGDYYNNPSFGYGGYCLPKDTKQLLANYKEIPQEMIKAIVNSNETRIIFLANEIVGKAKAVVGVYRLSMKSGSDNYRSSSIIKLIEKIREISPKVVIKIYEPGINSNSFMHCQVVEDLNNFKKSSDLIITNRLDEKLNDVKEKVFTRDIFHNN